MVRQDVSHYRMLERLGGGGMGVVYKAEDTRLKRPVALKFLPPELTRDHAARERFVREAQAASALDHPNICTIYEIDETDDGQTFIAMAYYDGETLKKKIERGPLPVKEALSYAVQVAEGLAAAHAKGIVHRDVKPANVMVTGGGIAKIVDFGLAKGMDVSLTQAGTTVGTVGYMSPEQARGEQVDARTDLWSLGVVLYEMLTGERPFRGDYEQAVLYAILNLDPEPVREKRPEVPEAVTQVVEKLLEKDPHRRYPDARGLLADLRALSKDPGSEVSKPERMARERSRRRRVFVAGGVAVLLVLLAIMVRFLATGRDTSIDAIAVLPLANFSGDPAREYFADGMTEELIATLGQIEALRVISRTSVMQYKGAVTPVPEIARELRVGAVVEGSVAQEGDRVRIQVRLVDGVTEERLWEGRFERELQDVLALQNEVALAIAHEIEARLTPQEEARLAEARPVDPEAFELYLVGRSFREMDTPESWRRAVGYFERSIERDSTYAPAHALLAISSSLLGAFGSLPPQEAEVFKSRARKAAAEALRLDEDLPDAHVAEGLVQQLYDWDWAKAEQAFRRAIALNPNHREAHREYGWHLIRMGRFEEGLTEMKRAQELDPLSVLANEAVGIAYLYSGHYDEAIAWYQGALQIDSTQALSLMGLGQAYLQKGLYEEAVATLEKAASLTTTSEALGQLGNAYAVSGKQEEAQEVLNELQGRWDGGAPVAYDVAAIYVGLGEKDRALEWLERAYENREPSMIQLKIDPHLDPLRSEPRFQALLKKMGLV